MIASSLGILIIRHYTQSRSHSIQSSSKCTTKCKNLNLCLASPHYIAFRPQPPALLFSGSSVYPGLSQINSKLPPNDLGWFLLCFDSLYTDQLHLLQYSVFKKGLISPPLRRAELWKTIWPPKIIHWLLPRGNLSQTLSNPCFTRPATVSPSNSIISLEILCKGRGIDTDIGPQHYLWSISPGDKDTTHCFMGRCFLSPSVNPAKRNTPSKAYYTRTCKLYLSIAGLAFTRKFMHSALQQTAVLSSSKRDLEIPCLHPPLAISF